MNALPFDSLDIITVVIIIRVIYEVDVPDQLLDMPDLTIEELVLEVGKLPKQTDELFIARTIKWYVDFMGHRSYRQQVN